jgi:hypothetical protein
MAKTKLSPRVFALGKAGGAAILALGLFVSSPYTNKARAIDINSTPNLVNASLVFSPTSFYPSPIFANLCAWNLSNQTVEAIFLVKDIFGGAPLQQTTPTIGANSSYCAPQFGPDGNFVGAQIIFTSPPQCSQATQYPGNCRVVASLEVYTQQSNEAPFSFSSIRHIEPVLLPGLPGSPRLAPLPQ